MNRELQKLIGDWDKYQPAEQNIIAEIWEQRDKYESMDETKLPLVCEYAKIFCRMQKLSDEMRTITMLDKEPANYQKLQKIIADYRDVIGMNKMKQKPKNRWADILLKRESDG